MCILPKSGSDLDAAADSDDWDAVAVPLEALLAACVDQRAKEIVEKLFAYLGQCDCTKKASNAATDMFDKHISSSQSHKSELSTCACEHRIGL